MLQLGTLREINHVWIKKIGKLLMHMYVHIYTHKCKITSFSVAIKWLENEVRGFSKSFRTISEQYLKYKASFID